MPKIGLDGTDVLNQSTSGRGSRAMSTTSHDSGQFSPKDTDFGGVIAEGKSITIEQLQSKMPMLKTAGPGREYLKLSGLHWSMTEEHIVAFFRGLDVNQDNVVLVNSTKKTSEQAFIFIKADEVEKAMTYTGKVVNGREIRLFPSNEEEYIQSMAEKGQKSLKEGVVRIRGNK